MYSDCTVYGCIQLDGGHTLEEAAEILATYPFAYELPLSNIFWTGTPARRKDELIPFGGSIKGLDGMFGAWLAAFGRLLSALHAEGAFVHVVTLYGSGWWQLVPASDDPEASTSRDAQGVRDSAWVIASQAEPGFPLAMSLSDLKRLGRPPRMR